MVKRINLPIFADPKAQDAMQRHGCNAENETEDETEDEAWNNAEDDAMQRVMRRRKLV